MTLSVDLEATFSADGTDPFRVAADFEVQRGETVVILGPSGSGKSLLLETIAGFHDHDGRITDGDRVLSDRPPEGRDFGFVFQDYALFPHMTVLDNAGFGTRYEWTDDGWLATLADRIRSVPGRLRSVASKLWQRLRGDTGPTPEPLGLRLLDDLGVADLAERYPPTLSGGERQRVALARALAVDPSTLLLDEPLSSLDVPTRQSLRDDLQDVLAAMTAIYVTHDRTTARALADRIVVMNDGEVVQTGTPEDVFQRPASPLVARFTGSNCVPLDALPAFEGRFRDGDATHLAVRPEDVEIGARDADLSGTVERVTREDATSRVTVAVEGLAEPIAVYSDDPPAPGSEVNLRFPRNRVSACQA
ncbi:Fe3+/spermidine/putrescine ABC transporter ATP-binding protein [Halorientalis sp. IM1011]|uniref:ABC transporter ATP-binding protein n=1 Tax=Halorientalis sp. IM1011 TaxID=1932360 RepID=UPI00097CC4B8|nr:ABC transporter ATP-binding protein [Halorientalis sp. IM1011]AQL44298.1 Fe3+/spermidine/putrescine ABC transporter ATP-binding protein [Halorientalis sp. IM1011]